MSVTIMNSGNSALNITSALSSGANPGDFAVGTGCNGAVLPVGGSCTVNVTFTPQAVGQRTAQVTVSDNAPNSPQSLSLTGQATAPFTITTAPAGSTSATVTAGNSAQFALQLTPASGFTGTLTLQCAGAPQGAVCSATPATTAITNGLPSQVSVTVTVATTGTSSVAWWREERRITPPALLLLVVLCVAMAFGAGSATVQLNARQPRLCWCRVAALVLFVAVALVGCGGGSSNGAGPVTSPSSAATSAGTYALTLTANWSGVSIPYNLTLTVR
jgi:hypothetical protein